MSLQTLKSGEEKPADLVLVKLAQIIQPKYKIIKQINRVVEFFDDPKIFQFGTTLYPITNDQEEELSNYAGGYSFFSEDEALLKCLGEALERYCLRSLNKEKLIKGSYKSLKSSAVDPQKFISFSLNQKKQPGFEIFNFDEDTPFRWVSGIDLIKNKQTLIPAQLAYLSYKLDADEKCIYLPITTGAAGGSSLTAAIVRGIYEIIERDAFIIYYLNMLPAKKIDLKYLNDDKINFCVNTIEGYNLELHTFDITIDLGISTFLSIVVDRTGMGPAVSLGLKTHLNPYEAILGSIEESLHPRGWLRRKIEDNPNLLKDLKYKHIKTLEDRAVMWYETKHISKLDFFLEQEKTKDKFKIEDYSFSEQLDILLNVFQKNHLDAFFVDVTTDKIKELEYFVVKVIIPQLQPFYLFEDYPYFGGTRLYTLPKKLGFTNRETSENQLNKYPHPFL